MSYPTFLLKDPDKAGSWKPTSDALLNFSIADLGHELNKSFKPHMEFTFGLHNCIPGDFTWTSGNQNWGCKFGSIEFDLGPGSCNPVLKLYLDLTLAYLGHELGSIEFELGLHKFLTFGTHFSFLRPFTCTTRFTQYLFPHDKDRGLWLFWIRILKPMEWIGPCTYNGHRTHL